MAIICVFVGYHVLCVMEFKDLVNLCIHYRGCHPESIGLGLVDIAIAQPFVHKQNVFFSVHNLHTYMVFC